MKKLLALLLALLMVVSLVACSKSDKSEKSEKDGEKISEEKQDKEEEEEEDPVAIFVEEHGDQLLAELEEGFTSDSSGMTCETSIKAKNGGVEVTVKINDIDDLTDEQMDTIQETYDDMQDLWDSALEEIVAEEPAIEYLKILVCEEDGDLIATILSEN